MFAIFRSGMVVHVAHSLIVAVVIEGHAVAFDVVFFSSGHISFTNLQNYFTSLQNYLCFVKGKKLFVEVKQ